MSPARRSAAALVPALLAAACGDAARARAELESPLFAAPLELPAVRPRRLEPLPAAAREVAAAPALEVRGGALPGEALLADPVAVVVDPSGARFWVLDRMQREVLAFDAAGRLVGRFGRRGRGPGEFEAPGALLRLPWNGHLAVWDAALQRLTEVTPEGEVVRTLPFGPGRDAEPQLGRTARRIRAAPDGYVYEAHSDPLRVPPQAQRGYLVAVDTLGGGADTLVAFRVAGVRAEVRMENGARHTRWDAPPAFAPEARWDVLPDGGVALAPGGPYELYLLGPGGAGALRVTRPWAPRRVSRADRLRRLETERAGNRIGRSDRSLGLIERTTRGRFARVRPSVTGVAADGAGRVWVRRFDTEHDGRGASRVWDVYAPGGHSLGAVAFPPGFHPLRFEPGLVYGVSRDALGVASVVAYRRPSSLTALGETP